MSKTKNKREAVANRKKRKREEEERKEAVAKQAFQAGNALTKDMSKNLKRILAGQIDTRNIPVTDTFYRNIINNKEIAKEIGFFDFALKLSKAKGDKMLENKDTFIGLVSIVRKKDLWIRDVSKWKRKSHNPYRQFASLVRHLFCEFPVPAFMDEAWGISAGNNRYSIPQWKTPEKWDEETGEYVKVTKLDKKTQWFLDIGNGKNIRKSKHLPIHFTKRMAHEFLKAPSDYTISEAMRWAQVISLGGDERMVQTVVGTKLAEFQGKRNEEFWATVIEFLAKNPMLDPSTVGPIIDFINSQKFEGERIMVYGQIHNAPAPNPNFSMKGRNAETLLRQTENWHEEINRDTKRRNLSPKSWNPVNIDNYRLTRGKDEKKKTYEIVQLTSYEELREEGRKMKHCVGSYAGSCAVGRCSIWSLRMFDIVGQFNRLVTIEVRNGNIVQIRGACNRRATTQEMTIINDWASKEGLDISRWC